MTDFNLKDDDIDAALANAAPAEPSVGSNLSPTPSTQSATLPPQAAPINPPEQFDLANDDIDTALAGDAALANTPDKAALAGTSSVSGSIQPSNNPDQSLSAVIAGKSKSTLAERLNEARDKVMKGVQAFNTGVEAIGSTIAKGVNQYILPEGIAKHLPSAGQIQQRYEKDVAEYQKNLAENPGLGVVNFAGNLVGSSVIPSSGLATVGGKAAGLLGAVTGGMAQGMLIGGSFNQTGQGTDVFNKSGVVSGAILGGVLGPLEASMANKIDSALDRKQVLDKVNTTINGKKISFKAPTFEATPNYTSGRIDRVLQSMPSYLGTKPYLEAEGRAFRPYISDMVNSVSNNNVSASRTIIGNEIGRRAADAKKLYSDTWTALPKVYADAGIKEVPIQSTLSNMSETIRQYGDESTKYVADRIQKIAQNKTFSPDQAIKAKQQVWDLYSLIQKNPSASPASKEVANKALLPAFWSLSDDIGNVARGTKAQDSFQYANGISKSYHNTFDPQVHPLLVNAVDDINESRRGVKALVSELLKPSTKLTEKDVSKYIDVMGPKAANELENIGLRKVAQGAGIPELIDNNMNVANKSLNLSKFLADMQQRTGDSSVQKQIYSKSYEALQGLEVLGKNFLQTTKGAADSVVPTLPQAIGQAANSSVAKLAGASALGAAGYMNPGLTAAGAAGIALTTAGMSALKAYQPAKNWLSWVYKVGQEAGVQPQLKQYMLQKANQALFKAGIVLYQDPEGTVVIDHKDNKKK